MQSIFTSWAVLLFAVSYFGCARSIDVENARPQSPSHSAAPAHPRSVAPSPSDKRTQVSASPRKEQTIKFSGSVSDTLETEPAVVTSEMAKASRRNSRSIRARPGVGVTALGLGASGHGYGHGGTDGRRERRPARHPLIRAGSNREDYDRMVGHSFISAMCEPLSTFSIDVDTASYANARRYIERMDRLPP